MGGLFAAGGVALSAGSTFLGLISEYLVLIPMMLVLIPRWGINGAAAALLTSTIARFWPARASFAS